MRITKFLSLLFFAAVTVFLSCKKDSDTVAPGDAAMISFNVGSTNGTINEGAKTVSIELPSGTDLTKVTPTISLSAGATVTPGSGVETNFTSPVVYTVKDKSGTKSAAYTVTATISSSRKYAFIGQAATNTAAGWDAIKGSDYDLKDDQTAATWFATAMATGNTVAYHSFEAVAGGTADLSTYDAIWIQYDGGWWGGEVAKFPNHPTGCLISSTVPAGGAACSDLANNFVTKVKAYYEAGGNIFLGNYAGSMVDVLGVVSSADHAPNNNFGGVAVDDGATGGAWGVRWSQDVTGPMFANIVTGADPGCAAPFFVMLDAGTLKKNRSNQYNLNFGPWAPNGDADPLQTRKDAFLSMTGGKILMENCGGNEILAVEWVPSGSKGRVITVLGGTYDWYVGGVANNDNIKTLTKNILTYLAK